ncbi:methyltransferase domain-containing protein [Mycoplasmatota bacterium WC30]
MQEKDMHIIERQSITIEDPFNNEDIIIDLGGGGEGIIGILRGKQVTSIDLRQEELDESPEGPIKVVADARNLPFQHEHFTSATAFFFFMYTEEKDRKKIFEEAFRVLKPNSFMYVWDVTIPIPQANDKKIFVIPLQISIRDKIINTGYGTKWESRKMNLDNLTMLAESVGFTVINTKTDNNIFHIKLQKQETN